MRVRNFNNLGCKDWTPTDSLFIPKSLYNFKCSMGASPGLISIVNSTKLDRSYFLDNSEIIFSICVPFNRLGVPPPYEDCINRPF